MLLDTERPGFLIVFCLEVPDQEHRQIAEGLGFPSMVQAPTSIPGSQPLHIMLSLVQNGQTFSSLFKCTISGTALCACAAPHVIAFCFGLEHLGMLVNKNKFKRLKAFGSLGKVDCRRKHTCKLH